MASTLLLIFIYIAFVSLGLPDSMLGAAWPMMYSSLGAKETQAGLLSMVGCFGTIISSLSYAKISKKIPTKVIVSVSILLTSIGLMLFSICPKYYLLFPIILVLGLGGGCIDSALNNYVTLHYSSSAISFLHSFWGIGTTIGPILLGIIIPLGYSWRNGYQTLSLIQLSIFVLSLFAFPLWKKNEKEEDIQNNQIKYSDAIKRKGVIYALIGFFAYCAGENCIMVWSSTYMVYRGLDSALSASYASFFFWGMTIGRMLTGFISNKLGHTKMIRLGFFFIALSLILFLVLDPSVIWIALFLVGIGCAPIYPMMIYQTPFIYGKDVSSVLIGLQMASAYVGSTAIPPIFGLVYGMLNMSIFPFFIFIFMLLSFYATEKKRLLFIRKEN